MGSRTIPSWTLIGLIRAFLDLALAYFILCGSTFGFFAWKCYHIFGLFLPCPCSGFFGNQNSNLSWHKLLNDQQWNWNAKSITDGKFGNGFIELQTMVDKESGYDAKGKKIINQKQKSGVRRRRRAAFGHGKSSPVLLSGKLPSAVAGVSCSSYINGGETRSQISENLGPVSEVEESFPGITGDEANRIRMLEQAIEEEKATNAALYLELEKERAAASSAADEAMTMILRLQEDKASIEMEARQYQRMIEEKFAYDEEEMNILKEILVSREKENHLLEKEVEAYRQINTLGDEQEECDFSYTLSKWGNRPSVSLGLDEDPLPMVKQVENSGSTGKKEAAKGSSWASKYENPLAGKQSHTAAVNLAGKGEGR